MEPVTVVTDGILAILGFIFGIILLYYYIKDKESRKKDSLMWIGTFFSVALFAFFGAVSHGVTSIALGDLFWPPTMIFGGITFVFLLAGVIIYQKEEISIILIIPVILVVLYLILCVLLNWAFLVWVILLLICSIIIFFYAFKAKRDGKELAPYLIYGLIIILIGGVIQAIGGIIGYQTYFGPNNEYLFKPHNDIFHVIAMIALFVFFIGFKKELKSS